MSIKRLLQTLVIAATILASLTAARLAATQQLPKSKEARDARMKWWREARFGMFIHWGVCAVPAGTYKGKRVGGGEWILRNFKIPLAEYKEFAKQFNPVKYDPDAWAALAEAAGMKYMVITSLTGDPFHDRIDELRLHF
jgi:alpha-L-fucosidase